MFGRPPPWGRDPIPDMHALLSRRHLHAPFPSIHGARGPPTPHRRHHHRKHAKHTCFEDTDTPSAADFSSSEYDYDPYSLDTDSDHDTYPPPRLPPPRTRHPELARDAPPAVRRTSVKLPSATADALRPDEMLILPPLTHMHILIRRSRTGRGDVVRAAAPESMRFGDVVQHVVAASLGDGVRRSDVRAWVKQRGRWDEPGAAVQLEELVRRGEVFRDARGELDVEIEVSDGGGEEGFGGRGPRGGSFGVERVVERRESRVMGAGVGAGLY